MRTLDLNDVRDYVNSNIEDKNLYTDIIEPIGHRAQEHNDNFSRERSRVTNLFTKQFLDRFCDASGVINWRQLVQLNSGNYDLDKFFS